MYQRRIPLRIAACRKQSYGQAIHHGDAADTEKAYFNFDFLGALVASVVKNKLYRTGATAVGPTRFNTQGFGFGMPGGIDMATIFTSAVLAVVSRIT